jgi:nitrogen fixation protein FixH
MSALHPSSETGFRIRGWHVAAGVSAFFAVVIAVDTTFAVLAYRTHPGQVSVTPYEDGLLYNRHIAQLEAQKRLGWQAAAEAKPRGVSVVIHDRQGRALAGLVVTGRLERPATETGRLTPRFVEVSPGRYEAAMPATSGAWDLSAVARDRSGRTFELQRRLKWP